MIDVTHGTPTTNAPICIETGHGYETGNQRRGCTLPVALIGDPV